MRQPIAYHPLIADQLRSAARPDERAMWLRLGSTAQEVFCAIPVQTLYWPSDAPLTPDFWHALNAMAASSNTHTAVQHALQDLPFRGGLAGYIGYPDHLRHAHAAPHSPSFPAAFMARYTHFVAINHAKQTAENITLPGFDAAHAQWQALITRALGTSPTQTFALTAPFQPLTPLADYRAHFARIQRYLQAGDCYQVNYAQAFKATCSGSSAAAMRHLLRVTDAAHAAWISLPEGDVLSVSPELFLHTHAGRITAKPIKGTAPRSSNPTQDTANKAALATSAKNQAENLMIVDLLRHDIGQHAETGSVRVDTLFEVESLPQVHHLVSTISATLKQENQTNNINKIKQSIDLIKDCFPGGSITGAPKKRAMQIIEELEPTARRIYCGSIGLINDNGDMHMNIAIRTLLRVQNELYAWAGGGIVADSECDAEYQECFDKIGALMQALEAL